MKKQRLRRTPQLKSNCTFRLIDSFCFQQLLNLERESILFLETHPNGMWWHTTSKYMVLSKNSVADMKCRNSHLSLFPPFFDIGLFAHNRKKAEQNFIFLSDHRVRVEVCVRHAMPLVCVLSHYFLASFLRKRGGTFHLGDPHPSQREAYWQKRRTPKNIPIIFPLLPDFRCDRKKEGKRFYL